MEGGREAGERTHTNTRTHARTHAQTHEHTYTNTHEHTNTSTTVAVREDAPRANERTKERTKRRESPWRQLLHPPTPRTLPPPTNSIGGAHHPRSVVSTRQAATCCDSTPLTHRTGRLGRLSQRWAITLHHQPAHSEPDSLRSGRVPQTHSPTRSQLTTTEPKLVQSDNMSVYVNKQLEYVS